MILHNEYKYILKKKLEMDDVFGMLRVFELLMLMKPFVNYMELDS